MPLDVELGVDFCLGKSAAFEIDRLDCVVGGDGNVVWGDAEDVAVFLVQACDCGAFCERGAGCEERTGDFG